MPKPLPNEATPLFREPPEGLIKARDDLVARLREEGRAEDAATVKALRKPTVVTWTLNQLAVNDTEGVTTLLDAGADVRAAQRAALSSAKGSAARLREASTTRRAAIGSLTATATAVLEDAGRAPAQHIDAVRRALETCSTDASAGKLLQAGTFERPPEGTAGFGDLSGLSLVPSPALPTTTDAPDQAPGAKSRRSRAATSRDADDQQRDAERKRLRRDRDAAVREARKAREAADRYAQELDAMRRRMAVVEGKHHAAEAAASAREEEAERAEAAFKDADGGGPGPS